MAASGAWLEQDATAEAFVLRAGGEWTVRQAASFPEIIGSAAGRAHREAVFDLSSLEDLDTAGAWALHRIALALQSQGTTVSISGVKQSYEPLLRLVEATQTAEADPVEQKSAGIADILERVGRGVFDVLAEGKALLNFFGLTIYTMVGSIRNPRRIRVVSLITQIEQTGLNAVPIVCLLSFLIGVVLAFQGADQLRQFGAEIFTVNLLSLSILREIGVLLTAIMLAGRSGSAFTAQIGTMQVNEEVDALRTLGLDPIEVLVLPRINALLITLPILTFLSDVLGILGGAIMAVTVLDITFGQFLRQLEEAVTLTHFLVGMVKAPVFAYIIAIVGCFEGLRVSGSAESVGKMTTKAVVESIFLVIIADAMFSILFSSLGI